MSLLETVNTPADLKSLARADLKTLAEELRAFIIDSVSRTGGHLASNLGRRAHRGPALRVQHAGRPHRLGRGPSDLRPQGPHRPPRGMAGLRQYHGLSGFPKREESDYDTFGTAHSSTSISAALGMAEAARMRARIAVRSR
jgi:1-deoxy-D-xylulose-5-phosphate synthase